MTFLLLTEVPSNTPPRLPSVSPLGPALRNLLEAPASQISAVTA